MSTSINLPQLFSGTWKLQPGVQILNQTGAGPFAIRNQFTGGEWVRQGKRLAFSAGMAPTFFGFLPGFGYQMGVLFSSAIPRIEADFAHKTSYAIAMSVTAGIVFLMAIVATALGPERRAAKFGDV